MIIASDISVAIGRSEILREVTFKANAGEVTAIVGPNGSGKTTLLRALTGDLPYRGTVTLDGDDVVGLSGPTLAMRRAVLSQKAGLAFPFTVYEVVRLGLTAGPDGDNTALPLAALAKVGMAGYQGRFYHELSGGEQQRCQLARVLVQVWQPVRDGKPSWLFLDEPVSSLDIGHQLEVMSIARSFADAGGGVVAVMHDLNLTSMFSDSVLLMKGGERVVQDNPAHVMTDAHLSSSYGCRLRVNTVPESRDGPVFILPQTAVS